MARPSSSTVGRSKVGIKQHLSSALEVDESTVLHNNFIRQTSLLHKALDKLSELLYGNRFIDQVDIQDLLEIDPSESIVKLMNARNFSDTVSRDLLRNISETHTQMYQSYESIMALDTRGAEYRQQWLNYAYEYASDVINAGVKKTGIEDVYKFFTESKADSSEKKVTVAEQDTKDKIDWSKTIPLTDPIYKIAIITFYISQAQNLIAIYKTVCFALTANTQQKIQQECFSIGDVNENCTAWKAQAALALVNCNYIYDIDLQAADDNINKILEKSIRNGAIMTPDSIIRITGGMITETISNIHSSLYNEVGEAFQQQRVSLNFINPLELGKLQLTNIGHIVAQHQQQQSLLENTKNNLKSSNDNGVLDSNLENQEDNLPGSNNSQGDEF